MMNWIPCILAFILGFSLASLAAGCQSWNKAIDGWARNVGKLKSGQSMSVAIVVRKDEMGILTDDDAAEITRRVMDEVEGINYDDGEAWKNN